MRFALTILWGLFCACSWTWCIGMYLPRLMIDRWGWWGFLVFAIPNVIGCTGFGYVVKNRARSEAMIAQHSCAMIWFSSITVAYHVFFLVWLLRTLVAIPGDNVIAPLAIMAIAFSLAGVFSFLPNRDWLGLGALVYAISVLAFWRVGDLGMRQIQWSGGQSFAALGAVLPFVVFGFLLCPYLDLTFHRAIQHSPSRNAFMVFGVTFAAMIVLSCAIWFWPEYLSGRWLPTIVMAHLLSQSVFTMGAHMRELRLTQMLPSGTGRVVAIFAPLAAAPLYYALKASLDVPSVGEPMYIAFLSLYGSVFPAWFAIKSLRDRATKAPDRVGG